MAVVIRMKRAGARKRPFYRVVVADSRFARDGRYIEQLGYYDPLAEPAKFHIDAAKFEHWIRRGARASESVEVMMAKHAPAALRPVPPAVGPTPEAEVAAEPEPKKAKKPKAAAKKAPRKPKAAGTKGVEKKAKTRAKAKAKKASGAPRPKAAKKPRK